MSARRAAAAFALLLLLAALAVTATAARVEGGHAGGRDPGAAVAAGPDGDGSRDRAVAGFGAGNRAGGAAPVPDVSPAPGDRGFRGGVAAEPPRGARDRGRPDGPRDGGGGRHGRPTAPEPAAPPARSGLEPPNGDGRGRKGDHLLPTAASASAPDPLLLLRFALFLGYRRVRPANLLDHPLRRALHDAVSADPGLDLAGCVAATGANRETLRYHLCLLVVGGRLVEEARNGSVRYFRAGAGLAPAHRALLHLGRNPSLAPILELVRDAPGISRKELACALGIAGPTATRQVGRLVADGLVEQQRSGRSRTYRLTPECAAAYATIAAEAAKAGALEPGCATA